MVRKYRIGLNRKTKNHTAKNELSVSGIFCAYLLDKASKT